MHVGGTYDKRVNLAEANAVVEKVRELLALPAPPSIGIACFNLSQRDAILDALDDAAAKDATFAAKLAEARARKGQGSFEGLFVKNLENVQGDERDLMIISTTYGPDPKGRFYRRFGPLGQAGGGRRLNVLVTRARTEVHPAHLDPPRGVQRAPRGRSRPEPERRLAALLVPQVRRAARARLRRGGRARGARSGREIRELPTRTPSPFARAIAARLQQVGAGSSDVYWGNDGFSVDVALDHPTRPGDVTVGVLVDGSRFDKAGDKVEWDVFRTRVLEGQGWTLVRLWSPHFFRDPEGQLAAIREKAAAKVVAEPAVEKAAANTVH